jgi:hypothetical protein
MIETTSQFSFMLTKLRISCVIGFLMLTICLVAQDSPLTISDKENLPSAHLWERYSYNLRASGGIAPYRWILRSGSLPHESKLDEFGELSGIPEEPRQFEFTSVVRDSSNPVQQQEKKFVLSIETPLTAEWDHTARVTGPRIDGSIKVSNRTGRDFDLTIIVLAVNDIGRATAIGYQHFSLKKDTRDFDIPFGDSVSRGSYVVNVDVVAEEPVSNRIFRARLVTGEQQVTQGP